MLVYFALTLIVLLGFVGLAVDVGRMELTTVKLQAVADDAALTAAAEYQNGNTSWRTLGSAEATSAGAAAGISSVSAVFQMHSTAGPYNVDYSAVQATVTQSMPIYFMSLVAGSKTKVLTATAVADVQPCSYFMSPILNSFELASASAYSTCPVYAAGSIAVDYFSHLNVDQAKVTGIQGTSYTAGSFRVPTIFNAPVLPDPLAYVIPPVFSACTSGDSNRVITTPTILYPGTYCGGLAIINTSVTLNPGLYIITGGFSLTQNGTISGTGVTLYFTQGGGSSFGNIVFGNTTGSLVNAYLSAPTDSSNGGIPAIVLYTDPHWTGLGRLYFQGCNWQGEGIFYSPTATVFVWASSMKQGTYFGMDASSLYVFNTDMHLIPNFAALPGGNPFHIAATLVQ